ncbi:hypothetical protein ACFQU2_25955 [Siccirubricoccus deserti]
MAVQATPRPKLEEQAKKLGLPVGEELAQLDEGSWPMPSTWPSTPPRPGVRAPLTGWRGSMPA